MRLYGEQLITALKNSSSSGIHQLGLRIDGYHEYFMQPIPTRSDVLNQQYIQCLTEWRNLHQKSFLSEFIATESRTATWLAGSVHSDPGRIIFMIVDSVDFPIGYMGLGNINWRTSYGEADSVVRGYPSPKGIMSAALLSLMHWSQEQLGLKKIGVRVISDNPALKFYARLGFVETYRVPLSKKEVAGNVYWCEDRNCQSPMRYLVHHTWSNQNIQNDAQKQL